MENDVGKNIPLESCHLSKFSKTCWDPAVDSCWVPHKAILRSRHVYIYGNHTVFKSNEEIMKPEKVI